MRQTPSSPWFGLFALIPALAMIFTDQTILPIALPYIQKEWGSSHSQLWWCINSYLLVSTVFLTIGGKLGDLLGQKLVLLYSMACFALCSILCSMSTSIEMLIFSRALQGVCAACIIPTSSPIIMSLFTQERRGKAIGTYTGLSFLFLIFAPLLGGILTKELSWRWIFWMNIPLAIIGIVAVKIWINPFPHEKKPFDVVGFFLFAISTTSFVIVLMQGPDWGWTSIQTIFLLFCFCVSALLYFLQERKKEDPLLPLYLLKIPSYKAAALSVFATQFALMITIYRIVFFQTILHWSIMHTAIIFSLTATPLLIAPFLAGYLSDRFQPKSIIALGFTLLIISFLWIGFFVQSSLPNLILCLTLFNSSLSFIFTPSRMIVMNLTSITKSGSSFGLLSSIRTLASTFGVAVITLLANYLSDLYFSAEKNSLSKESWEAAQIKGFTSIHLILAGFLTLIFLLVFYYYRKEKQNSTSL